MKTFFKILAIGFFVVSCAAPLTPVTLQMQNGKTEKGFATQNPYKKIKFKKDRGAQTVKYDFENIESAEYQTNDGLERYVRLPVNDSDKQIVVKEVEIGKVSLYTTNREGYNSGMVGGYGGAGGMGMGFGGHSYNINNYYLKRDSAAALTHLGSNQLFTKNFKDAASDFFKDCAILVKKIQDRDFKKRDLNEIVTFYNANCK